MAQAKRYALGAWMKVLSQALDNKSYVSFETMDGAARAGKVTGLRYRQVELNGRQQDLLTHFELNDDTSDTIEFASLRRITIQPAR